MDDINKTNDIKKIVKTWLDETGWKYQEDDDSPIIRSGMAGKFSTFNVFFVCDEEKQVLQAVALTLFRIPEAQRREVAEFMARINYHLLLGSLKMDMSDGELRYEVAIDVEDGVLTPAMVQHCCMSACTSFDRSFPHVMSIIYGGKTAEEAFVAWREAAP